MQVSDYREKIIRVVKALFPEAKVILYGSRARGTEREFSDIDLALDAGQKLSRHDVQEAVGMFAESNIPYKIDIVDFYSVPPAMQQAIREEGVLWKD